MLDFHRLRKLCHAPGARERAKIGLSDLAGRTWAAVHTQLDPVQAVHLLSTLLTIAHVDEASIPAF
eukprot:12788595-Heterocapsa_arctica.AAC.1